MALPFFAATLFVSAFLLFLLQPMIGNWLNDDTPVQKVTAFAAKARPPEHSSARSPGSKTRRHRVERMLSIS